ncbi:putative Zn finger protein [Streptacidiphilus sp. MAP12-20]|uniref:SWIM zinc finger family protein n=1 Tax=Streptacidiphilus sp. MAP12-20 TaxID=3156299 RepID=UPI003514E975
MTRPWSERFLARVESLGVGLLADQMREAGGSAQVRDVVIAPGSARARVGGVEAWADLAVFDAEQWQRAEAALVPVRDRLLARDLPPDVDALLARIGLPLLPAQARELTLDCACGYSVGVCRHVAALLGAVARAFDHDPFLLLRWRGRDEARLLARLRRGPHRAGPEALSPLGFWTEPAPYPPPGPDDLPPEPALAELGGPGATPQDRALERSLERALRPLYDAMIRPEQD